MAENCKLKEELLQEQHANELRTQQMRKLNTAKETQMNFTEKIEVCMYLNISLVPDFLLMPLLLDVEVTSKFHIQASRRS